jgi:hypothetical protein
MDSKDFKTEAGLTRTSESFDRAGNPTINKKEKTFAKIDLVDGGAQAHYIQTLNNDLYDPNNGMYSHREDNTNFELKYKKVSKDTFDFYMLFLKTKNSLYFTRAQRSFLND